MLLQAVCHAPPSPLSGAALEKALSKTSLPPFQEGTGR